MVSGMSIKESLAAAELNLAPARRLVKRSPESLALDNLITAVRQLDAQASERKAKPTKAAK